MHQKIHRRVDELLRRKGNIVDVFEKVLFQE
jgi:hypothetical protein